MWGAEMKAALIAVLISLILSMVVDAIFIRGLLNTNERLRNQLAKQIEANEDCAARNDRLSTMVNKLVDSDKATDEKVKHALSDATATMEYQSRVIGEGQVVLDRCMAVLKLYTH
jgi:cell division protein FtsB